MIKANGKTMSGHGRIGRVIFVLVLSCSMVLSSIAMPFLSRGGGKVYAAPTDVGTAEQRCKDIKNGTLTYTDTNTGGTNESGPTSAANTDGTYNYEKVFDNGSVWRGGNAYSALQDKTALDSDKNDFASVLPYGTVYIDVDAMKFTSKKTILNIMDDRIKYNLTVSDAPAIVYQRDGVDQTAVDSRYHHAASGSGGFTSGNNNSVTYIGGVNKYNDGGTTILTPQTGKSALFTVTYKGAAILNDGTRGDLVLTFKKFELESAKGIDQGKPIPLYENNFMPGDVTFNDKDTGEAVEIADRLINVDSVGLGIKADFDYAVLFDDGSGNMAPYNGIIAYSVRDLDVNSVEGTWKTNANEFDESLAVTSGAKSYAVVPRYDHSGYMNGSVADGDSLIVIEKLTVDAGNDGTANNIRFRSGRDDTNTGGTLINNGVARDDGNTYDTGFAVLLDSAGGTFEWTGATGRGRMGTTLFDPTLSWKIVQSVSTNGVNNDNDPTGGTGGGTVFVETYDPLNNCEHVADNPGLVIAGTGETVTHTIKANPGYSADYVQLDNFGKIYFDEFFRGLMPDSTGKVSKTVSYGGSTYYLEKAADGMIRISFVKVDKNHAIHVNFINEPPYKYVKKQWIGGTEDDRESITLVAQAYRHVPVVEVNQRAVSSNLQFYPWWYSGTNYGLNIGAVKRVDPNGDGVTVMKRQKYYPSTMNFSGFVPMSRYDETNNKDPKEASALQYSWDGNFYAATGWDNVPVGGVGSYTEIPAWTGATLAETDLAAAAAKAYYLANATGSDYERTGANRAIKATGIIDESSGLWLQPHLRSGARSRWERIPDSNGNPVGVNYYPTGQGAILLPADGYRAVPSDTATKYTKKVTVDKSALGTDSLSVSGDTWTIKWPARGGTVDGIYWPALPEVDEYGNPLYWFVTEQAPELDDSSDLKSSYKWELTRYQNSGSISIKEMMTDPTIGPYALGDQVAATENPWILSGGSYKDTQPGYTSRAYLGDSPDNAGLIVNDRVDEKEFTKKWVDDETVTHTADELYDKIRIFAVLEDGTEKEVTETYIDVAGKASKKYTVRSQLAVDGDQYKVKEIRYVNIEKDTTDSTGKTFKIKLNHMPEYYFGDNAASNADTVSGTSLAVNSATNNINGSRNNFDITGDGSAIKDGVNSTVQLSKKQKINYYYIEEKTEDLKAYVATYENSKDPDTTDKALDDTSDNKGVVVNSQKAKVTITKKWDDELDKTNRVDTTYSITGTWSDSNGSHTYSKNEGPDDVKAAMADKTINKDNSADANAAAGSVTWEDLPAFSSTGVKITYTVTEDNEGMGAFVIGNVTNETGYTDAGKTNSDGVLEYKKEIKNTLKTIDVTVEKVWDDNNNQDGLRSDVTFTLTPSDAVLPTGETKTKTIAKDAVGDDLKTIWSGLPAYHNGAEVSYSVTESTLDGYTTAVTPEKDSNGNWNIEVKNTHIPYTASLSVFKKWDDADDQDGLRKEGAKVILESKTDSEAQYQTVGDIAQGSVPTKDGLVTTWLDLPVNRNGEEITYKISENISGLGGYYTDPTYVDETFTLIKGENKEATITNKQTPAVKDITITKVWDDMDDHDNIRPDSVEVVFTKTYKEITETEVDADKEVSVNNTKYVVKKTGDIEYFKIGDKYYRADDIDKANAEVSDYEELSTFAPADTDETVKDSAGVAKTVEVDGNTYNVKKDSNGVEYYNKDDKYYDPENNAELTVFAPADTDETLQVKVAGEPTYEDKTESETIKLTAADKDTDGNWTRKITGLDEKTRVGQKIVYSVSEESVPDGYTASVTSTEAGLYTVTNKHEVVINPPKADPDITENWRGMKQTGTPTFKADPDTKAPGGGENKIERIMLIDPKTGNEVTTVTVPGEGTYVLNDDGTITFTPEPDFVGTASGVKVRGYDSNDQSVETTYTPIVKMRVEYKDPLSKDPDDPVHSGITNKDKSGKDVTTTYEEEPGTESKNHPGYTFEGWDEKEVTDPETGEIYIERTAKYTPMYKITYDPNGGTGVMTDDDYKATDKGMPHKDNEFTRKGYDFVGFKAYVKDPVTGKETPITDKDGNPLIFKSATDMAEYFKDLPGGTEIRMEAQWEPQKYTIKYDANGGKGTMTDQNFTGEDEEAVSKDNEFTRKGYTFTGFKAKDKKGNYLKDEDGNDLIFEDPADFIKYLHEQGNGGEITLVAQWRKLPTAIYIDPATGRTIQKTLQFIDENTEPDPPADPTRKGYRFTGWKRFLEYDADGNIVNVRYEAQWELVGEYVDPPTLPDEPENPEPTPEPTPSKEDKPTPKGVKTGDNSTPIAALVSVLAAALIAAIILIIRRRRD